MTQLVERDMSQHVMSLTDALGKPTKYVRIKESTEMNKMHDSLLRWNLSTKSTRDRDKVSLLRSAASQEYTILSIPRKVNYEKIVVYEH